MNPVQIIPKKGKFCNPTSLKVLDTLHGISLLAVLGTAIWNVVLTVQEKATIQAMKPIFITSLIANVIKIPSQICAANTRGSWMSLVGSLVTIIITSVLIGYLLFDPAYANDKTENICAVGKDGTYYCLALETSKIRNKCNTTDPKDPTYIGKFCDTLLSSSQSSSSSKPTPDQLRNRGWMTGVGRQSINPAHWSPVFL